MSTPENPITAIDTVSYRHAPVQSAAVSSPTAKGARARTTPLGTRPGDGRLYREQAGRREGWLSVVERQERLREAALGWCRQGPPGKRYSRLELAVYAVGINPSWGIVVRLRRPPTPDGGLRLVA